MIRLSEKELKRLLNKPNKGRRKYGNVKVEWNGIKFDSIRERNRYIELSAMQKEGKISELKCQVKYQLIPEQRIDGKQVEKPVIYIADFTYRAEGKRLVVEDVKGFRKNPVWIIKRKLMLWLYGIRVMEV